MTLYRASQDRLATGITVVTVLVLLGLAIGFTGLAVARPGMPRAVLLLVAVACAGILAVTWAYRPIGYSFSNGALLVQRKAGDVVLPFTDIRDAQIDPSPFDGAIRVAGSGGLFGFWGRFRSRRLGWFTAYATRRDRGVVLEVAGRRVVLTPDEPERLLADVRPRMGG
jgi:hypothetical protein